MTEQDFELIESLKNECPQCGQGTTLIKFCSNCGALVNPKLTGNPECNNYHEEYALEFNDNYCPDCGIKIKKSKIK